MTNRGCTVRKMARGVAALGLTVAAPVVAAAASSAARPPHRVAPKSSVAALLRQPGTEIGFAVFQTQCTRCHGNPAAAVRAPSPATLRQMPPERIYAALTTGSMRVEARSS
jgi:mono/diheme cytochrome c family protein